MVFILRRFKAISSAATAAAVLSTASSYALAQTASPEPGQQPSLPTIQTPNAAAANASISLNDPDIKKNANSDLALFQNAIAKLHATHANILVIPRRVYNLKAEKALTPGDILLDFSTLSDVTVVGNGSQLNFYDTGMRAAIRIGHSNRVVLQGITIDWVPILAFPGRVTQQLDPAGHTIASVLTVDSRYSVDPKNAPKLSTLFQFDLPARRYINSNVANYDRMLGCPQEPGKCPQLTNAQQFLLPASVGIDSIPNNSTVVATLRSNNFAAILIENASGDITLDDITIYSSPGAGITVINAGHGFHFHRVSITRKPDELLSRGEPPRLISTAADAINFIATGGDILVENCDIGYEADDGINIRGKVASARRDTADTQKFTISESNPDAYIEGDQVSIRAAATQNTILAHAKILNVQKADRQSATMSVDPSAALPADVPIFVSSDKMDSGNYAIEQSKFHDNKNRGIVVRGGPGVIKDNVISGTTSSGIQLAMEWYHEYVEGPPAHDVIVRHNKVSDTNRGDYSMAPGTQKFPAAIMVYATDGQNYIDTVNERLRIEDNVITDVPGLAIFIGSARDVSLTGNTFNHLNGKSYERSASFSQTGTYITHSQDVSVSENHTPDERTQIDQATTKGIHLTTK